MANSSSAALPVRILLKFAANTALVWLMREMIPEYFVLTGDATAVITVGAIISIMNIVVRPILGILTLPLKLFATLLAIIVVNGVIVQLTVMLLEQLALSGIALSIGGGISGLVIVAIVLGFGNWLSKAVMK